MTRDQALALFGDPSQDRAGCISALCEHLGISKQAFYQWPDPIPRMRELELEKVAVANAAKAQLAASRHAIEHPESLSNP